MHVCFFQAFFFSQTELKQPEELVDVRLAFPSSLTGDFPAELSTVTWKIQIKFKPGLCAQREPGTPGIVGDCLMARPHSRSPRGASCRRHLLYGSLL